MRYIIALAVLSSVVSACTKKKKTSAPGTFDIGPIAAVSNVNTPTITWTGADRATSYDLVISSSQDCQTSELSISAITGTEQTVTALVDGTHYACVSAVNEGGSTSANNNGVEFVTDVTPPEAFSITGPTTISGVKPAVTWSESKGADAYDVKISKQSDCSSPVVTRADISKTTLSLTPDDELEDGGVYYACVAAKDLATNTTAATNGKFSFTAAHWRTITSPSNFVGREGHSAVWTGDGTGVSNGSMIVFGGIDANGNILGNGAKYDPVTNTWTAISSSGAPSARYGHTAVWTGSKMIVWGGCTVDNLGSCSVYSDNGAIYDPSADSWSTITTSGAPTARVWAASMWTGTSLLIWGGEGQGGVTLGDGKLFNPTSSTWSSVSATSAPTDRAHAAYTNGDGKFFIWGGVTQYQNNGSVASSYLATGGIYDVASDTWSSVASTGVNSDSRYKASAVWTGSSFVVWAGAYGLNFSNTANGMAYDYVGNQWSRLEPSGISDTRSAHSAVWTKSGLLVWGGLNKPSGSVVYLSSGGLLNPETGSWSSTSTVNSPASRAAHTAVWTGDSMLVWGGYGANSTYYNNGALYFP